MPSDLIETYDFESGEPIKLTIQGAIDLRNKYGNEAHELNIYVMDLTNAIEATQKPIAESLRGNSNTSKHTNGSTDINS